MYAITQFGTITLPTYNTEWPLEPLPARLLFVETTGGAFDNDGDGRNRQTLPFALRYQAVVSEDTYNNNRGVLDTLRAAVGTRAKLYRTALDNNAQQFCTARLSAMPHTWPFEQRGYFVISLDFQQLSPWNGAVHGVGWFFDAGIVLDNARTLDETPPTTLNTSPKSITIANAGNLPVDNVQFILTAGSANITTFSLSGPDWGFSWSGILVAGSTLTIDTGAFSVLNAGGNDYANFTLATNHKVEKWVSFTPGNNTFSVAKVGGSTNSTLAAVFYDRWA